MTKKELLSCIRRSSDAEFDRLGFRFSPRLEAYIRKEDHIEGRFYVRLLRSGEDHLIESSAAVRFGKIEEIFHRTSGVAKESQMYSNTLWVSMETASGMGRDACVSRVVSLADVPDAVELLGSLFQRYAVPYLDRHRTISDVDQALNSNPASASVHCSQPRCHSYGIIAAALVGSKNFLQLVAEHRKHAAVVDRGFHLPQFDALCVDLDENFRTL